jgi:hypothetical protein
MTACNFTSHFTLFIKTNSRRVTSGSNPFTYLPSQSTVCKNVRTIDRPLVCTLRAHEESNAVPVGIDALALWAVSGLWNFTVAGIRTNCPACIDCPLQLRYTCVRSCSGYLHHMDTSGISSEANWMGSMLRQVSPS